MQINAATLLASQQLTQVQAKPQPGFAAALEKTGGFEPLPIKQMMPTDEGPTAKPAPAAPVRLGATIDIRV